MFSQNKYDMVFMDLYMPVISVSAENGMKLHSKCLDAGITDHIAKPVEVKALFAMISKWLPR